jgi:hypothetical protein
MRAGSANLLKDSSTHCFYTSLTMKWPAPAAHAETDSIAGFFGGERFGKFARSVRAGANAGSVPMAMSLLVSRLSVVAAYVAFAFVGAIVLGLL